MPCSCSAPRFLPTGIATYVPTIQVDLDHMNLGKFHPVDVPLWGGFRTTLELLAAPATGAPEALRARWRAGGNGGGPRRQKRRDLVDGKGHPALIFDVLGDLVPGDAAICCDVGSNTPSFGHFFEVPAAIRQDVIIRLPRSFGFRFASAMGAWAAATDQPRVVSISGDGGFRQYLADLHDLVEVTAWASPTVLLDNGDWPESAAEQVAAIHPMWQTSLVNPTPTSRNTALRRRGFSVRTADELRPALRAAMAITRRPSLMRSGPQPSVGASRGGSRPGPPGQGDRRSGVGDAPWRAGSTPEHKGQESARSGGAEAARQQAASTSASAARSLNAVIDRKPWMKGRRGRRSWWAPPPPGTQP